MSVNPDALSLGITDLKVTFSHSRGSLEFTEDNIRDAKGYFMMPNADKNLSYKVEGLKADGTPIKKEGIIQNVERAHEYVLNITAEAGGNKPGGALIKIRIDDIPLIEEVVEIYGRPTIEGVEFNIDEQVVGIPALRRARRTHLQTRSYMCADMRGSIVCSFVADRIFKSWVISSLI